MRVALGVARLGLRRRVGSLAGLALLIGLITGLVLTLVGGARRTVSTIERLRDESLAGDLYIQPAEADEARLEELRSHPDVEAVGVRAVAFLRVQGSEPDLLNDSYAAAAVDEHYLRTVDRPRVLEGTFPDAGDPSAVAITEAAVEELGVGVGDRLPLESLTPEHMEAVVFGGEPLTEFRGPRPVVEVAAIVRPVDDALGLNVDRILFTPAFWAEHGDAIGGFDDLVLLRARDGADLDALSIDVQELWADDPELAIVEVAGVTTSLGDILRTQAIGLLVAAAAVAVAGAVVVAQALRRSVRDDDAVLTTFGITRTQHAVVAAAPLFVAILVGVALSLAGTVSASRVFPTGRAARVEPTPGVRVDGPLLAGGGAVALLVAIALAAAVAIGSTRRVRARVATGRAARLVSRGPVVVSAAAHLATRRGVPIRPALAGAVVALGGAVAAVVFGASLNQLVDDPARDGFPWDAEVGVGDGLTDDEARRAAEELADREGIDGVVLARYAQLELAGTTVQTAGLEPIEGDVGLLVLDGSVPTGPDEVALGPETAEDLEVTIGDTATLPGADTGEMEFVVSGLVRFPNVAEEDPATGVAMTLDALARLLPPDPEFGPPGFPTLFARWSPGADGEAIAGDLADEYLLVNGPRPSNQVLGLREVRGAAPRVVAILALLGLAAVVHALLVSVRRAHRDVSVLAVAGCVGSQRAATVVAQGLGYLALGLAVGVPLGIVVGRWTWQLLADQLAVAPDPVVPARLALVVPFALAAALLAAAIPARRAARIRPAEHLRTE